MLSIFKRKRMIYFKLIDEDEVNRAPIVSRVEIQGKCDVIRLQRAVAALVPIRVSCAELVVYRTYTGEPPLALDAQVSSCTLSDPYVLVVPTIHLPLLNDECSLAYIATQTFYIANTTDCATVVWPNVLATFKHGSHSNWRVGDTIQVSRLQLDQTSSVESFRVTVAYVSDSIDFVLLLSDVPVVSEYFGLHQSLRPGMRYLMMGASALFQYNTPFALSKGTLATTEVNQAGCFLGTSGSNVGDSGRGVYSHKMKLIGINVGNESIPPEQLNEPNAILSRHPARCFIVPSWHLDLVIKQRVITPVQEQ